MASSNIKRTKRFNLRSLKSLILLMRKYEIQFIDYDGIKIYPKLPETEGEKRKSAEPLTHAQMIDKYVLGDILDEHSGKINKKSY